MSSPYQLVVSALLPTGPHGWPIDGILAGYTIEKIDSVEKTLARLRDGDQPDGLILLSGARCEVALEALQHLRAETSSGETAIVVMGDGFDEHRELDLLEAGADAVLPARGNPQLLRAKLDRCFRRSRTLRGLKLDMQDMSSFVRTLTHDIKNPVGALHSSLQFLKSELEQDRLDAVRDLLDSMEGCAAGVIELIDDLLELLRQGAPIGQLTEQSSREIIEEALDALEIPIRNAQAKVEVDGDFPTIQCDRRRVLQAFVNLISNAIKYVPDRSQPEVVIRGIDTSFAAIFCVVDNGIGVPDEERQRIFQPFVRLRSHHSEGTGIGLAIVRQVVLAHGGALFVQGLPRGGSEFYMLIPHPSRPVEEESPVDAQVGTSAP